MMIQTFALESVRLILSSLPLPAFSDREQAKRERNVLVVSPINFHSPLGG